MKLFLISSLSVVMLCAFSRDTKAQDKFGIGLSGIYNFQTEAIGAGLRAEFLLYRRFSIVPQVQYFPSFNKVHEVFGGANLHYALIQRSTWRGYLIAGGSANYWVDYAESNYAKAKAFNVIAEAGAGVVIGNRKLRPFVEYRYNPIWKEGALHVGLMYFPKRGKGRGGKGGKHGKDLCPAYKG